MIVLSIGRRSVEVKKHEIYGDKALGILYKLLSENSPNLALYIDFSLLRYPLVKITAMPISTEDNGIEFIEFLGLSLAEILLDVNAIYKNSIDFDKDVFSVKLLCEHGWIVYEYTVLKSNHGVPYVSKSWIHIIESKSLREIIDADEEFIKYVNYVVKQIASRCRIVLEYDGYL